MENYTQRRVEEGLFGYRYLYLNDNTRIRYGYSFRELGASYVLQRYNGLWWKRRAWAYGVAINTLDEMISYLFYSEEKEYPKKTSLF
jgi:hypothetical protein